MSSVDLTNELRLAKPRAPEQLRERVLALSERPVREPRFSFSLPSRYTRRRVAFVAAPAVVAVAVGGAVDPRDRELGCAQPAGCSRRGRPADEHSPVFGAATRQIASPAPSRSAATRQAARAVRSTARLRRT